MAQDKSNKPRSGAEKALADAHNLGAFDRINGKPKNPKSVKKNLRKAYEYGWNKGS